MANIKVCDRCGKEIIKESGLRINIHAFAYRRFLVIEGDIEDKYKYSTHDLCPDCVRDHKAFLEGAEIIRKEVNS